MEILSLTPEQLASIKDQLISLYNLVEVLCKRHGNEFHILRIELQNASFDGTNCSNYSHENEVKELQLISEVLNKLVIHSHDSRVTYIVRDFDLIIRGEIMSSDESIIDIVEQREADEYSNHGGVYVVPTNPVRKPQNNLPY